MTEARQTYFAPLSKVPLAERTPQTQEEAQFLQLVKLCDESGAWRPGLTLDECKERAIPRPDEYHPTLYDARYHIKGDPTQPLNRKGREYLDCLDYGYCRVTGAARMLVYPRDEDVNLIYHGHLARLDESTPTHARAAEFLQNLGHDPTSWQKILDQGMADNTRHELRAVILIALGDIRPMGAIYHDLRRRGPEAVAGKIGMTAVGKTGAVTRKKNPLGDQPAHF